MKVAARLFLICELYSCFANASEFRLFNHQSLQYKAWVTATNRMLIARSATHVGIPSSVLLAVCFAESSHQNVSAVEDGNSLSFGICQVKYETALFLQKHFKIKKSVTISSLDLVSVNSFYAALYLRYQFDRYNNWIDAIEAYNKGTARSGNKSKYVRRVLAYTQGEQNK